MELLALVNDAHARTHTHTPKRVERSLPIHGAGAQPVATTITRHSDDGNAPRAARSKRQAADVHTGRGNRVRVRAGTDASPQEKCFLSKVKNREHNWQLDSTSGHGCCSATVKPPTHDQVLYMQHCRGESITSRTRDKGVPVKSGSRRQPRVRPRVHPGDTPTALAATPATASTGRRHRRHTCLQVHLLRRCKRWLADWARHGRAPRVAGHPGVSRFRGSTVSRQCPGRARVQADPVRTMQAATHTNDLVAMACGWPLKSDSAAGDGWGRREERLSVPKTWG
jgi:hypothetical protein